MPSPTCTCCRSIPGPSDDGFGVVDHREVNPELGTWDDIADLRADHALALDFVANHVSRSSPWFRGWLARDPRYDGYFLEPGPDFDTSQVVRPRITPLLHEYARPDGTLAHAWTTFGPDQVDIDPSTPAVLIDLTDVLLGYLARGATTVRLDAIGYLWKESGTTCIHLPQTHDIIRIWRVLVDALAPGTLLLTETNVPHADNIAYFGDGSDEAHMVYQFALPAARAARLRHRPGEGARRLGCGDRTGQPDRDVVQLPCQPRRHRHPPDGRPADRCRSDLLVERTLARGGRVSMARRPDGSEGVYELNTNFLDALVEPGDSNPDDSAVVRGLAAHAILLSVIGVPAIYYHSLLGSGQDRAGMAESDIARRINREVLDADLLQRELESSARRSGMLGGLRRLLEVRRTLPGFSPFAGQAVEQLDERVLVLRRAPGTDGEVIAAINVSGEAVVLPSLVGTDALSGRHHDGLTLEPYGFAWLRP